MRGVKVGLDATDGLIVDIEPGADYLADKPRATSVVSFSFGGQHMMACQDQRA